MAIDFSIFKGVNFSNLENIVFLLIIFVLFIILLTTFLFILAKILKAIKGLFSKIFKARVFVQEIKSSQEANADSPADQMDDNKEYISSPKVRIIGGDSARIIGSIVTESQAEQNISEKTFEEKGAKSISEHLDALKSDRNDGKETLESKMPSREEKQDDGHQKIEIPRAKSLNEAEEPAKTTESKEKSTVVSAPSHRIIGGDTARVSTLNKKETTKEQADPAKVFEIKQEKTISEHLNKLKSDTDRGKETLESKMPSRDVNPEDETHHKIEIPRAKHLVRPEETKKEGSEPVKTSTSKIIEGVSAAKVITPNKEKLEEGEARVFQPDSLQKNESLSEEPKHLDGYAKQATQIEPDSKDNAPVDLKKEESQVEKLKTALTDMSPKKDEDIEERLKEGRKFQDKSFIGWVSKIVKNTNKQKEEQKKIEEGQVVISSGLHDRSLFYDKGKQEAAKITLRAQRRGLFEKMFGTNMGDKSESVSANAEQKNDFRQNSAGGGMSGGEDKQTSSFFGGKPEIGTAKVSADKQVQQDDSIFSGKNEISRIELRQKLRFDPKIAKVQRDLRMNLSPIERTKLEKETFAPLYGRNISKEDLKLNVRRLGREWATTGDMKKKETLRKQIKFFKKIGGIK